MKVKISSSISPHATQPTSFLTAFISPYRAERERMRAMVKQVDFI